MQNRMMPLDDARFLDWMPEDGPQTRILSVGSRLPVFALPANFAIRRGLGNIDTQRRGVSHKGNRGIRSFEKIDR